MLEVPRAGKLAVFFYSTWSNSGMYLAILFYQPGKNIAHFFSWLVKKNG